VAFIPKSILRGLCFDFAIPAIFVLIWFDRIYRSRRAVAPHADLQLYLVGAFCADRASSWDSRALAVRSRLAARQGIGLTHLLAGVLMQGIYLCASYWSIRHGMAAGVYGAAGVPSNPCSLRCILVAATRARFGARNLGGTVGWLRPVWRVFWPRSSPTTGTGFAYRPPATLFSPAERGGQSQREALIQKWLPAPWDLRSAACRTECWGCRHGCSGDGYFVGSSQWDNTAILWIATGRGAVLVPSSDRHNPAHVD